MRRTSISAAHWLAQLAIWILLIAGCGSPAAQHSGSGGAEANSAKPSDGSSREARRDLAADEARGGHTLRRHVGRSDEELRERLASEQDISAASTWTDRSTAEEIVAEALDSESTKIERWESRGERRPNLAFHFDPGRVIGRSLLRGAAHPVDATQAVIVLKADSGGFYVLTTYPEARQ